MDRAERDRQIAASDAHWSDITEQFGVSRSTVYRIRREAAAGAQRAQEQGTGGEDFAARAANQSLLFDQQGRAGFGFHGGQVSEEFQRELQGDGGIKIYTEMATHPVSSAVLFAIEMAIRSVKWMVEPAGEDKGDEEAAEFLEQCRDDMSQTWDDLIAQALAPTLSLGSASQSWCTRNG